MDQVRVAIVGVDNAMRLAAAKAFDRAPSSWLVSLHREVPEGADVVVLTPEVKGEGLRFDPDRPHDVIEAVKDAGRGARRVVVVTGASGGIGATSIALHLAAVWGRRGRTCYFDLDPGGGSRLRLGMPADARTWADVCDDEESLLLAALPVAPGLRAYVASPDGQADPRPVIERAASLFERVVIDAPAGGLDVALDLADVGVLVAAPTFPSIERARDLLGRHTLRWAVVTNRIGPGGEATRAELEAVLGRTIGLELPCAPRLRDAEDDRRLLDPAWSRWARRIERLATVLEET
jgi:MinD-like ATPase involved in chromosome partitioning or flagellar assembly